MKPNSQFQKYFGEMNLVLTNMPSRFDLERFSPPVKLWEQEKNKGKGNKGEDRVNEWVDQHAPGWDWRCFLHRVVNLHAGAWRSLGNTTDLQMAKIRSPGENGNFGGWAVWHHIPADLRPFLKVLPPQTPPPNFLNIELATLFFLGLEKQKNTAFCGIIGMMANPVLKILPIHVTFSQQLLNLVIGCCPPPFYGEQKILLFRTINEGKS